MQALLAAIGCLFSQEKIKLKGVRKRQLLKKKMSFFLQESNKLFSIHYWEVSPKE